MDTTLKNFLSDSDLANKIKIQTKIVIHNNNSFTSDILTLNSFSIPEKETVCNLEIGNQIIGSGKIVKKNDKYYFKLTNIK